MEENIQKLFNSMEELHQQANVNAAFGHPVTIEGRTVIPVAEVSYGFGMGFGSGTAEPEEEEREEEEPISGEGGGGGGGMRARPLGVVEVTEKGVRVESVVDEQKIAIAGVLLTAWVVAWVTKALISIFGPQEG